MILDNFRLDGQVALVTGASTGLGQAIAIALAEAGADVVCHGNTHSPDATCEAVTIIGRKAFALTGDLSDRETPSQLIENTLAHFGQLDILVNNAGTIRRAPALEYSDEDWQTVIEVNLSSVFRLSQLAGRQMIAHGRGKILNIASLLSFQGGITVPAYAASKGGAAQLTGARERMGCQRDQRQRDRAGLYADGEYACIAARRNAQPADTRTHTSGALERALRAGGRRRVSLLGSE
ncbi:MAG TPA: SDR family NAD(P)-dependent oxidoreductase [Pyrinomonadaceae bacterium]|nr:SDR family NAD(P)-dependent oxidoreductase [Pyrinomonadaceae bacterium]